MRSILKPITTYLEAIKFSHSVFALPFAIAAAFMAAEGVPSPAVLGKIVLACVLARTAAMSFNRYADAEIDRRNPRTASRAVPRGEISRTFMLLATLVSSAAFVLTALWIHRLAFTLSPAVLLVLLGYSYTKRWTSYSHLVLGLALGLSPVGAWIAIRESIQWAPVALAGAVLFWTAGFDVIYSCVDRDVDHREGLHSIPRRFGIAGALRLSRVLHLLTFVLLATVGGILDYGVSYWSGVGLVAVLLVYEHNIVSATDLSRVNVAFFTVNGMVSLLFMGAVIAQVVL